MSSKEKSPTPTEKSSSRTDSPYASWSQVHDISQVPSRLATVALHHGRFQVAGPTELTSEMQTVIDSCIDNETMRIEMQLLFSRWHVICSVSGTKVRLCDLRYWDVDKGLIFSDPYLIGDSSQSD